MESFSSQLAVAQAEPAGTFTHPPDRLTERELLPGLPPQVFTAFIGTYGAMLLSLWLFFSADINAIIALTVCTAYFSMYFGVPLTMVHLAGKAAPKTRAGSLSRFLSGDVDTYTGRVSGWGAIAQLLTIPIGLTGAFIAFGIIIQLGA